MFELKALYTKPAAGAPMQAVSKVSGVAGQGIVGDANADPNSPRQVLLVSARDLTVLKVSGRDLRANLVVHGDLRGLRSGSLLRFGTVAVRITIPCEPCGRLNDVRPRLSREIGPRRGVLARVVSSGDASIGDRGSMVPDWAPPLALDWRERVYAILMAMPVGRVLSYSTLARAAGVQQAYCRAMPSVLRSLALRGAPVHRVVPADPSRIDLRVIQELANEGIDIRSGLSSYLWSAGLYYSAQEHLLECHEALGRQRRRSAPRTHSGSPRQLSFLGSRP